MWHDSPAEIPDAGRMNWLAHVFLSTDDPDFRLGNLTADLFKGSDWQGLPANAILGVRTHRAIDAFTDAHPVVKRSMRRLGDRGLLRGVAIDIAYDHFLAKDWESFSPEPLQTFLDRFHRQASHALPHYPPRVRDFLTRTVRINRLSRYRHPDSIHGSLQRIDTRLSQRVLRRENASSLSPRIAESYAEIHADFREFLPLLQAHTATLAP